MVWEYVAGTPGLPSGAQSSKDCPSPFVCGGAQAPLQQMFPAHSQPLAAFPSQFTKPGLQATPHVPALQVEVALGPVGHARPQPPQLLTFVAMLVSQPSLAWLLQSAKPAAQLVI
jgi:hypothetical protein